MPSTKTRNLEQVARWFHALSDETRLQIIECVLDCEQCVCDLTDVLKTGQSRLSFHLKTLKDAGILLDRKEGRWVYYSLNPEVIEELQDFIGAMKTRSKNCSSTRCR
jgi:ArsR family transcriptional regulator